METQSGGVQAELDFLQHLLIGFQEPSTSIHFKLTLFDDEEVPTTSKDDKAIKITKYKVKRFIVFYLPNMVLY